MLLSAFPLLADEHTSACVWRGWSPSSPWKQTALGTPRWGCSTRPRHISRCGSLSSRSTVPSWDHGGCTPASFFTRSERWRKRRHCDRALLLLPACRPSANATQTVSHGGRYYSSPSRLGSACNRISFESLPSLKDGKGGLLRSRMKWKFRRAFTLRHPSSLTPPPVRLLVPSVLKMHWKSSWQPPRGDKMIVFQVTGRRIERGQKETRVHRILKYHRVLKDCNKDLCYKRRWHNQCEVEMVKKKMNALGRPV